MFLILLPVIRASFPSFRGPIVSASSPAINSSTHLNELCATRAPYSRSNYVESFNLFFLLDPTRLNSAAGHSGQQCRSQLSSDFVFIPIGVLLEQFSRIIGANWTKSVEFQTSRDLDWWSDKLRPWLEERKGIPEWRGLWPIDPVW